MFLWPWQVEQSPVVTSDRSAWTTLADDGIEWPADGQAIRWRRRDETTWHEAVVAFVWMGIEPAIKTTDGKNIFPTLGDQFEKL